uniref:Uncharacterized protein n=1 Tax=Anguilla anguilla TaxID=7936 RepID=A0A0E9T3U1_ANGAN
MIHVINGCRSRCCHCNASYFHLHRGRVTLMRSDVLYCGENI